MNSLALSLFHALPPAGRSLAAGLHGWRLQSWRYGPETDGLVEQALAQERWTSEQWRVWREERLAYVLHRAATRAPYYRALWSSRRQRGDRASWDRLENWPTLEKAVLHQNPLAFVADDCDVRRMYRERTSGTTGKPLTLWWSRETSRAWFALLEARVRAWNGVSRRDRWAILGGQLVTPFERSTPPFWVWNRGMNQLYLSSFHLAPDRLPSYIDALCRYRVRYLLGYSSCLYLLAKGVLRARRRDVAMQVVIANAEGLHDFQRAAIAEAFQCPVRETYGMAEIAAAASECEAGGLHEWPEAGIVEIAAPHERGNGSATGDLICTGLLNADMPLIRYRVGDAGTAAASGAACTCGRSLPLFGQVHGRNNDLVVTRDGRRVYWLNPVFYGLPVQEAQIVQEDLNRIRVLFAPAADYSHTAGQTIVERLRKRVGDMQVDLEPVESVPREANGKFRAVISKLSGVRHA